MKNCFVFCAHSCALSGHCGQPTEGWHSKPAFSLVEMLMALLVASLLLAALAPVITRKFGDNVNIYANNATQSKGWRLYTYSSDCTKVEGKDNVCEFKDFRTPHGIYAINLIMSSGGGGGASATNSLNSNVTVTKVATGVGSGTSAFDEQIVPITEYMTNVKVEKLIAGGAGGGGGAGYVSGCPSGTYEFAGNSSTKAFCMTKYNIGEFINGSIPDYIPRRTIGIMYAVNDTEAKTACAAGGKWDGVCCWRSPDTLEINRTSNPCTNSGNYGTCNRVLCQYRAAEKTCNDFTYMPTGLEALNWGLPTKNQIDYFKTTYTKAKGNLAMLGVNGIYLCDVTNTAPGLQQCHGSPGCYGVPDEGCRARAIWVDNGSYYLQDGVFEGSGGIGSKYYAFSARCTLDKTKLFNSLSGGGGGAGAMLSDIDITNYVKKAGPGGRIRLLAGRGGSGGAGAVSKNSDAADGADGGHSYIYVQRKNSDGTYVNVYTLFVSGAWRGGGAKGAEGTGARGNKGGGVNKCAEMKEGETELRMIPCSEVASDGAVGVKLQGSVATGGRGANSPFTLSGGGFGATSDSITSAGDNAGSGAYGAGGGGGTAIYGYNDIITSGRGGNGAGGFIKITYTNEYPGAGGGGGAGGNLVKITNLPMTANTQCIINVGGGGDYGNGQNGRDGGDTSIKCGNNAQEYIVYGGGGGKIGTSGNADNNVPIGGLGGSIKKPNQNILQLGTLAEITYGEGNDTPVLLTNAEKNKIKNKIDGNTVIGGNGGKSGTDAVGGCGGLRPDSDPDCTNNSNNNATEAQFIDPLYTNLINGNYGKTGAGGGGGGWSGTLSSKRETGSSGQPGYLFLWWEQE